MRIILEISYDGTAYCGWQRQKNGLSVQEVLENAIFSLTGERVSTVASGRTDAGVHALGQIAHFDTNASIPPEKFSYALNSLLPDDIKILKSRLGEDDFHARYSAKKKTYAYSFYLSEQKLPLKERYSTRVDKFDLDLANKVCEIFIGEHDFKCFLSSGSEVKTTVRKIFDAKVYGDGKNGFTFTVTGNGFLYNMVRIMAGTILAAIDGKITLDDVKNALLSGDRGAVGKTAPSKGLTLVSVVYD